jgi:CDP-glycerol glycerophosphotransferase (TagB/SpsB family)
MDQATVAKTPHATWPTRLARRLAPEFDACWLLMDRDTEAHDNAEHLYRHLRDHRPEINAWFVLNRTSSDWARLDSDGFRLVAHGSFRHVLALSQCRELVSSQIDHYVISPLTMAWLRRRPWWFTWLQHGVIQSDLSGWLRGKPARTVVTTTPAEHRSLSRPPYTWTEREVVLTGQPRHDALVRAAQRTSDDERTLVLVMPTWRKWLLQGSGAGNGRTARPGFAESPYVRNWLGLVASGSVRMAAAERGLEVVLLPHPNMAPHLRALPVPDHVRVADYAADDVQDLLVHATHVVTDYSSTAFDAALINRPVLYFQFDAAEFHSGADHIGRPGYFDYERDGFGPVAATLPDAERMLVDLIAGGASPTEPYATRIRDTFTVRDGHACERVVAEILRHRQDAPEPNVGGAR